MVIKKRDGREVEFDRNKIVNAVLSAQREVDGEIYETDTANSIADDVELDISENWISADVESIQDDVEEFLMASDRKDVARAYVRYRYKREAAREFKNDFFDAIGEPLEGKNTKQSNANVDEVSHGGRVGEACNKVTSMYTLERLISPLSRKNHEENMIYIHDRSSYPTGSHNCLTLPIDPLAKNGSIVRGSRILRPCGSFTSFGELSAVWMQLQSLEQFGGVSYSHYDWSSVLYVRKSFRKHWQNGLRYIAFWDISEDEILKAGLMTQEDWEDYEETNGPQIDLVKGIEAPIDFYPDSDDYEQIYKYAMDMLKKEIDQTIEALYHNLNTLQSRSGNQLPFSSINYGTCTLPEGRMVIKSLLEKSIEGIGEKYTTPIFPCGIFQLMKGVNRKPGDPNYDLFQLALKSTSKRLYPNYANVDWSGNAGYDPADPRTYFSTMGCRTANGWGVNAEPGQNPQLKDGRGNICPVTIIMPTLAMMAKENPVAYAKDKAGHKLMALDGDIVITFLDLLDQKIYEAKDMLLERFEYICSQPPESAKFMFKNGTMFGYKPDEGIRSALKHGTLAIGQIGLAETLQILTGKDHTTPEGMELAKRIEQLFKDRCAEFKEEYKLNFGVYYTPAESLCHTSLKKFRDKYGVIKNVSDKDFFTNSIHVPVWKQISPYDKIDIESQLTGYSSAGCITYVELDSTISNNLEALEQIVNYAMDKDIPYFAVNVPNDTCLECGYTGEFNDKCPMCGSENIQQLRRVTGYLTGNYNTAFNKGKQDEV